MNQEVKQRWIQALEGGKYHKWETFLRASPKSSRFCCLGVLCDLHARETGHHWQGWKYLGEEVFLPQTVLEWSGLSEEQMEEVALLNDNSESWKEKVIPYIGKL